MAAKCFAEPCHDGAQVVDEHIVFIVVFLAWLFMMLLILAVQSAKIPFYIGKTFSSLFSTVSLQIIIVFPYT